MSFRTTLLGLAAIGALLMIQPVMVSGSSGCQQSCSSMESTPAMPVASRQIMTAKAGTASACQQSCSSTKSMTASSGQVMTAKAASSCQQSCSGTESMTASSRQVMKAKAGSASNCQQSCSGTTSMTASSGQVMKAKAGSASDCQQTCSGTATTPAMPMASRQVMTASRMVQSPNIVEIAVSNDDFSTLVAAVKAAGLVEALSADGPVTVFAPTNEAFGRIDKDTIAFLLTDQGRPQLERILLHHVVAGRLDASDLVGKTEVETLAGTMLSLEVARDRLFVDKALVQSADIGASNGVIHVIDRVMLPPTQVSPLEMVINNAIERGVPMFNNNNSEGCAAVYATALDAIASVNGFGLNSEARAGLAKQLQSIADMRDSSERAWAYRRIMDSMLSGRMQM